MASVAAFIAEGVCREMVAEASRPRAAAETVPSRRIRANRDLVHDYQHGYAVREFPVNPFQETKRPTKPPTMLVACVRSEQGAFSWFAMNNKCYHDGAALCNGVITTVTVDIEDAPTTCLAKGVCVECPGHGYLYLLATGDYIVPKPELIDGRMRVQRFKAVRDMQRPYTCVYVEGEGLHVHHVQGRFASD